MHTNRCFLLRGLSPSCGTGIVHGHLCILLLRGRALWGLSIVLLTRNHETKGSDANRKLWWYVIPSARLAAGHFTPQVAGCSRDLSPNTHTNIAHPCQEWLGASGAPTPVNTQPNTPARSGGAQPKSGPKHTHPQRAPQPRVAGCKRSAHTSTHTPQQPSQEWRGAAGTRARTHTPTARTPARSGGVQAERPHQQTHSPTPQQGVAGRSRNPSQNTHTHSAHPSQEWQGASGAPTPAHTQPNTPARSGGAQPKPKPKHTHPYGAPVPGVAGCRQSAHRSTHTAEHPSQEWRGAAETRAQTHTPTPRTLARSGGVQPKPKPKHTHPHRAPVPGVGGCKRSAHTSTHTAQHPSQEWRGAAETRAEAHTPTPHTQARSGEVQAEHAHEHTHSPTPQPGVAGRSQNPSPSTHTHTAHASQGWRGAAETQAKTHTPTPCTRARSSSVQAERAQEHTHRPTPQPGVAGRSRKPRPSTHTHTAHPGQEWPGASGARTRAHTQPNTPARSGGAQPKPEPEQTHPQRTPQPGVAGRSRNPSPNTHIPTAHPCQEWRDASGARTGAHTHPNTPARSGGARPKPEPKHRHPRRTPQPGVAGCKQSAHTSRHKPRHSSQDWRGAAGTRTQPHTPTLHT